MDGCVPHPVELHVQAAGVADGLALGVPPPQGGVGGVAVSATEASTSRGGLQNKQINT